MSLVSQISKWSGCKDEFDPSRGSDCVWHFLTRVQSLFTVCSFLFVDCFITGSSGVGEMWLLNVLLVMKRYQQHSHSGLFTKCRRLRGTRILRSIKACHWTVCPALTGLTKSSHDGWRTEPKTHGSVFSCWNHKHVSWGGGGGSVGCSCGHRWSVWQPAVIPSERPFWSLGHVSVVCGEISRFWSWVFPTYCWNQI